MRVNFMMLAFQPEVQIYPIDIKPTVEQLKELIEYTLNGGSDSIVHTLLDMAFTAGNKDSRVYGRLFCSVSCGDVALFGDEFWLCSRVGWRKLTVEQMAEYCAMDRRDRTFCTLLN